MMMMVFRVYYTIIEKEIFDEKINNYLRVFHLPVEIVRNMLS